MLAIARFNKVPEEGLDESINIETMNVSHLRMNLKKVFEEVLDAVVDFKYATNNAKVSLEDELVAIKVTIDKT